MTAWRDSRNAALRCCFWNAAECAALEWLPIFSNVTEKSVHTLISFVFRPAKAHRAFAGRLHGGAARYAHHHGVRARVALLLAPPRQVSQSDG